MKSRVAKKKEFELLRKFLEETCTRTYGAPCTWSYSYTGSLGCADFGKTSRIAFDRCEKAFHSFYLGWGWRWLQDSALPCFSCLNIKRFWSVLPGCIKKAAKLTETLSQSGKFWWTFTLSALYVPAVRHAYGPYPTDTIYSVVHGPATQIDWAKL